MGDSVEVYLDAGATPGNTPSTIIDATELVAGTGPLRVLREGVIDRAALEAVAPGAFDEPEPDETAVPTEYAFLTDPDEPAASDEPDEPAVPPRADASGAPAVPAQPGASGAPREPAAPDRSPDDLGEPAAREPVAGGSAKQPDA